MANRLAKKYPGAPCVKNAAHVSEDGTTLRYESTKNCVECAHEYASEQTRKRKADREAARLANVEAPAS